MISDPIEWTAGQLAADAKGQLRGPAESAVAGLATDSRDPLAGRLFVALRGKTFDGHDFLAAAARGGASALLVDHAARVPAEITVPVITVPDTLRALGDLAQAHHRRLGTPVLALTGSSGKTSTKEMLAAILAEAGLVLKTEGNFNNLIGMPLTLLRLRPEHAVAVLEFGMNSPGEIARLTEIAEPVVGMVINVGPAHIGELGSLEAIAAAKGELFERLARSATCVVNADDPRVVEVARKGPAKVRRFGSGPDADVALLDFDPASGAAKFREGGAEATVRLPYLGRHNALNAAAAIACATAWAPIPAAVWTRGLERAPLIQRRLSRITIGDFVVIDDGYNANRASMLAAIETVAELAAREGRRFTALLGEMRELGAFSPDEHAAVGQALEGRVALLGAFGPGAGPIASAVRSAPAKHETEDAAALFAWFRAQLRPGDVILIKGSRGIRMERYIDLLRAETH